MRDSTATQFFQSYYYCLISHCLCLLSAMSSARVPLVLGCDSFVEVEVPGLVRSVSRALEALGGQYAINSAMARPDPVHPSTAEAAAAAALHDPSQLRLRLRPDDTNAVPLLGEVRNTSNSFLLEIRTPLPSSSSSQNQTEGQKHTESLQNPKPQLRLLGKIVRRGRFPNMADFQVVGTGTGDLPSESGSSSLKLVPPAFSGSLAPRDYRYRIGQVDTMAKRKQQRKRDHVERYSRFRFTPADVEVVPKGPEEGSFAGKPETQQHPITMELRRLFEERPVFSKLALMLHTAHLDRRSVLRYVPAVAYRFQKGPFRTFWTRYGYDPRKDRAAMCYQNVDFRFGQEEAIALQIDRRRELRQQQRAPVPVPDSRNRSFNGPEPSHPDVKLVVLPSDVDFSAPPVRRVMQYQLCDLAGAEFRSMLNDAVPMKKFDAFTGWVHKDDMEQIRAHMNQRLRIWLSQAASKSGKDLQGLWPNSVVSMTSGTGPLPMPAAAVDTDAMTARAAALLNEDRSDSDESADLREETSSLDEFDIFGEEDDDDM